MQPAQQPWQEDLRRALDEWQAQDCPDSATHPAAGRMSQLAESFHALEGLPGVRPWSPLALARTAFLSPELTGASQLTAVFVLKVWNPSFPCPTFDVIEALGRWDPRHRAAFLAWANDPWWP